MPSGPRSASGALASGARIEILHVLQMADTPLTVVEVAEAVGRHTNTVREHLDRLVAACFAVRTLEPRLTRGRPRILYRAAERAAGATLDDRLRASLTRLFLADLDVISVEARGAASPVAGAAGAPSAEPSLVDEREQIAALGVHLEDLGFDPEPEPAARCVHLRRCPFATLARERTELTCSVHLDVIKGVMATAGGPLTADRLEPFVGPEHCLLHLRPL